MQIMVTITQNNRNPEMLAAVRPGCFFLCGLSLCRTPLRRADFNSYVRRGPFSPPTAQEKIEYLLTRLPKTEARKDFESHALEHVMSFQRRVVACKREFLARQKRTPLGIVEDYWDKLSGSKC